MKKILFFALIAFILYVPFHAFADGISMLGGGVSSAWVQKQTAVSVKAFGAVGDGVINDTNAINTAINSLPTAVFKTPAGNLPARYGHIHFPAGVYKVTTRITLPAGSHIIITGSGRAYQDVDLGSASGGTVVASTDVNGVLNCRVIVKCCVWH